MGAAKQHTTGRRQPATGSWPSSRRGAVTPQARRPRAAPRAFRPRNQSRRQGLARRRARRAHSPRAARCGRWASVMMNSSSSVFSSWLAEERGLFRVPLVPETGFSAGGTIAVARRLDPDTYRCAASVHKAYFALKDWNAAQETDDLFSRIRSVQSCGACLPKTRIAYACPIHPLHKNPRAPK
jgi:hypothetical protein